MESDNPRAALPVCVPIRDGSLNGDLTIPSGIGGLVIFAHGSGSSRHSPRNHYVARVLERRGLATLLIDLLTAEEEVFDSRTARLRFDIDMLGRRIIAIVDWLRDHAPGIAHLPIGLFGASTGGGAALVAAAQQPQAIAAVVSRGGRPDLAGAALGRVVAPTLLIVGGEDAAVIEMNRSAMTRMRASVRLEIVPGATHLFEEPGTLERVATMAADFFLEHVHRPASARRSAPEIHAD
jgi:dienelactone hydrolase